MKWEKNDGTLGAALMKKAQQDELDGIYMTKDYHLERNVGATKDRIGLLLSSQTRT